MLHRKKAPPKAWRNRSNYGIAPPVKPGVRHSRWVKEAGMTKESRPAQVAANDPGTVRTAGRERLDFVQWLRAFAALGVLGWHVAKEAHHGGLLRNEPVFAFATTLQFGVDLFFIISGFIMVYVTANPNGGDSRWSGFMTRRLIRLVPAYWLFTAAAIAIILAVPDTVKTQQIGAVQIAASFLFIPWPDANGAMLPALGVGWTLNYEMLFYVLFAVALAISWARRLVLVLGMLVALVMVGFLSGLPATPAFWTRNIILEFGLGMMLGWLMINGRLATPWWLALAAGLLGVILWQVGCLNWSAFAPDRRGYILGPAAALIFIGVSAVPVLDTGLGARLSRWLLVTGDASYVLYLSHMFVIRLCTMGFRYLSFPFGVVGYMVLASTICLLAAVVLCLYVEKPVLALMKGTVSRLERSRYQAPRNPSVGACESMSR